ncbi:MAG: glycosyltransferase family 39 protein [Tepidisphaeraceae bacterium]
MTNLRWYHIACLALLLIVGTFIRLPDLGRFGAWRDEYWGLYLATGRGDALFQIPLQTLITSPPPVGFAGAPHWWHIWTGLHSVTHPPLYYFLLRGWVDLFGESDRSVRIMSLLFGLGCIALLFDSIRTWRGPWYGLVGAGIMTFAPIQIDFCVQARPYTLIAFEGLLIAAALFRIERHGPSALKLLALASSVAALVLTHYFAIGIVIAATVYALLRFKRATGSRTLATITLATGLAAALWAPELWHNRGAFHNALGVLRFTPTPLKSTLDVAQRLTLGQVNFMNWPAAVALAIMTYVLPPLDRRKTLWWLWTLFTIGIVLAVDLFRHSGLLQIDRYPFIAAPAVYAILAMPLPGRLGKIVPLVVLFGAMAFGIARYQQGPELGIASVYQLEDHRATAKFLRNNVISGDAVIIAANGDDPAFTYFAIEHYNGEWKVPVLLISTPLSDDVKRRIFGYRRVWVVGRSPADDTAKLLQGCSIVGLQGAGNFNSVWRIKEEAQP